MLPDSVPEWVGGYVGLPYETGGRSLDGVDCWGLVELAYNAHSGHVLPAYDGPLWYGPRTPGEPIGQAAEAFAARFAPVAAGEERLFDAVLLRIRGFPMHVGLIIAPGWMLHSQIGADSSVERYRPSLTWENRIAGFFRHV